LADYLSDSLSDNRESTDFSDRYFFFGNDYRDFIDFFDSIELADSFEFSEFF